MGYQRRTRERGGSLAEIRHGMEPRGRAEGSPVQEHQPSAEPLRLLGSGFTATPSCTSSRGGEGEPQGEGAALCRPQQGGDQPQGQVYPEESQRRDDPQGDAGRGPVSSMPEDEDEPEGTIPPPSRVPNQPVVSPPPPPPRVTREEKVNPGEKELHSVARSKVKPNPQVTLPPEGLRKIK